MDVKKLGVKIDTNLLWQHHVNDLSIKLNRANAVLFKIRKYVSSKTSRSICFAIFDSYFSYSSIFCYCWVLHLDSTSAVGDIHVFHASSSSSSSSSSSYLTGVSSGLKILALFNK